MDKAASAVNPGGPKPSRSMLNLGTYGATTNSENVEAVTYELTLSKISPEVFKVSGDYKATLITRARLETSLAGTVLLVEHDGHYGRLWTWLWKYGMSRDTFNTICIEGKWPGMFRGGSGYVLIGGQENLPIHETILEKKWSGRLLIQGFEHQPLLLFKYFWQDVRETLASCYSARH